MSAARLDYYEMFWKRTIAMLFIKVNRTSFMNKVQENVLKTACLIRRKTKARSKLTNRITKVQARKWSICDMWAENTK